MFQLRFGYLFVGIATGLFVLFSFLWTLPDGKLHIVFCDVGQGDAAYVRFPDGRDMLVDGGPGGKVLACLGKFMPFWDRTIDLVLLTHPERDHLGGLPSVLDRYRVNYFVKSDVDNDTQGYRELMDKLNAFGVALKYVTQGETITIGQVPLFFLWPSEEIIARRKGEASLVLSDGQSVLGSSSEGNLNDFSLVFLLSYGSFEALLTGDADTRVEGGYRGIPLGGREIEVLKVPHHGSRTGMSEGYLEWVNPELAVISVGKNTYGHPTEEILEMLRQRNIKTVRTDIEGHVEVVSDGENWTVKKFRLDKE